ncbi:hypothetical protein LCGC14_2455300 [marine sediment metagenome]|uniref:Uncharacterized protein n=1 Tax=marine sediment metagenome TaxID=412755 RepID=A0A0F9BFD7_9ZZZZ
MKNELNDAWDKRVEDDNAAIKEIANRLYGGETDLSSVENVQLSLQERAKLHGCMAAASWEYDYATFLGEIAKHTGLSLQEVLLYRIMMELKFLNKPK